MTNLLSFEMSDCFTFTTDFFCILQVSCGVLRVAMKHQLLYKSLFAALQMYFMSFVVLLLLLFCCHLVFVVVFIFRQFA